MTMTDTPMTEQSVTMSAADLQKMILEVSQGGGMLPPGAYRENGQVFRDILEPTGRVRAIKGADGKPDGRLEAVNRRIQRPVYLYYDMSAQGLVRAKHAAQVAGLDFFHPVYGWLRHGVKREVEVPENLGTGAQAFEMVYTPIEGEDDIGSSVATMQGVDAAAEPPAAPQGGLAGFDEALATDVPQQAAAGSRRNKEN